MMWKTVFRRTYLEFKNHVGNLICDKPGLVMLKM